MCRKILEPDLDFSCLCYFNKQLRRVLMAAKQTDFFVFRSTEISRDNGRIDFLFAKRQKS